MKKIVLVALLFLPAFAIIGQLERPEFGFWTNVTESPVCDSAKTTRVCAEWHDEHGEGPLHLTLCCIDRSDISARTFDVCQEIVKDPRRDSDDES